MMMKEEFSTENIALNILSHITKVLSKYEICENTIAFMKEYNVKYHYTTKHSSQFDEILGQA